MFFDVVNINCKAFKNGIPKEILNGSNDHSKPLKDQGNDIVFEPINYLSKSILTVILS